MNSKFSIVEVDDQGGTADSPGEARGSFIGFVKDEETAEILRKALSPFLGEKLDVRCATLQEACQTLGEIPSPKVVLVDVSGFDNAFSELMTLSGVIEPDVKVVVIGDSKNLNFYREIKYGLGIAEYLYKPLTVEITARLLMSLFRADLQPRTIFRNSLVLVSGAGGGVGSSTVAVNLAKFLADHARRNTLLYDPNCFSGMCATLVNVEPSTALKSIYEKPDRVDQTVMLRAVRQIGERLSILSSDLPYGTRLDYTSGAAKKTLELLEHKFNYIVADVTFEEKSVSDEFYKEAVQRVYVMEPTITSLKSMTKLLRMGDPPNSVRKPLLILNKAGLPGELDLTHIEGVLQQHVDAILPYVPALSNKHSALGQCLINHCPQFLEGMVRLAAELDSRVIYKPTSKNMNLLGRVANLLKGGVR